LEEQELTQRLFAAERIHIENRRAETRRRAEKAGKRYGDRTRAPLTGLALSGGGIRRHQCVSARCKPCIVRRA
ncbi:MAG: hypothetical protein WB816_18805, partial [Methylocystis sp.]